MPAQEDRHQQGRHLLVGHPPVGVGVDHPVDRRVGQRTAVALGPDDGRRVECGLRHGFFPAHRGPDRRARTRRAAARPAAAGPADGRSASPAAVLQQHLPAPPARHQQLAAASTHDSAISLPPPPECRAQTTAHSAQRPRPYETFSTLQPATIRWSSTSAAAPTGQPRIRRVGAAGRLGCLVPQHLPVDIGCHVTPADRVLNAFRTAPSHGSTREVGNPNFERHTTLRTANTVVALGYYKWV